MSASPQRNEQPDNRRDLVSRFRLEYADALAEARVSAEHTAQAGWQGLYKGFYRADRDARRKLAAELKGTGERLELSEIGEDGEKGLAEVKKNVAGLREAREVFDAMTVGPVRACVEKCQKLIADTRRQAEADYERAPMVNIGLVELVDDAVNDVDRVTWDSDEGRVVIKAPGA